MHTASHAKVLFNNLGHSVHTSYFIYCFIIMKEQDGHHS